MPSRHMLPHEVVLNLARESYLHVLERELRIVVMYAIVVVWIVTTFSFVGEY
jgi:hypothetical protein